MALPEIIQIQPPHLPVRSVLSVPGSKSITNRALILAALKPGETVLSGALWSEDTQIMVDALRRIGYRIEVQTDASEPSNRTITVSGRDIVPSGGRKEPIDLFVGNAGTAARFLAAFLCLENGSYRLHGIPRMHERPQAELFAALRQLGYRIDATNDHLPAIIFGAGARPGKCRVSIRSSSQFASALLLCAQQGRWTVEVEGENAEEASYVRMTREMIQSFARFTDYFEIEPDASSASYFVAADHLLKPSGSSIGLRCVPKTDWQVDGRFASFLPLPAKISRKSDLADSILTAMVVAPFGDRETSFTEIDRLRVQECDRVTAMRMGLEACGVRVREEGSTLTVFPLAGSSSEAAAQSPEIETFGDHRIAMCFAVLALRIPGISIRNPACVKKTFPDFFVKLAQPPPDGLGAKILDPRNGRECRIQELSSD